MKRFLTIALVTAAAVGTNYSSATAEEKTEEKPALEADQQEQGQATLHDAKHSLRVHTQQSTTQDGQETRNSYQVTIDGRGDASELADLQSNLESRLSKSGLPDEMQRRAIDEIFRKIREITSDKQNWAGRVTWTSKSPEEMDVVFEALEESAPTIENQRLGVDVRKRLGDATERLNDRLKKMSERARPSQNNEKGQTNFRIGIN